MIPTMQIGQLGIARRSGTTYLDQLGTTPRAVMSLRKKISNATVSVRVRRSSDNAEQDIGFDGDALDTASLSSFVGANSAYVVKFYDQTGNGEHAENPTSASQPRIVNAGAYGGELTFDGTDDFLKITSLTMGSAFVGLYYKLRYPSPASTGVVVEAGAGGPGSVAQSFTNIQVSTPVWAMISSNAAGSLRRNDFSPASITTLTQVTSLYDRSLTGNDELKMWVASVSQTPTPNGTVEQTGTYDNNDVYVGARSGTSLFMLGGIETLVIYNADSSGVRSSIETLVA